MIYLIENFAVKPTRCTGDTEMILLVRLEDRLEAIHADLNEEEIEGLKEFLEPYNPRGLPWNTFMRIIKTAVTPHQRVKDKGRRPTRLPVLIQLLKENYNIN